MARRNGAEFEITPQVTFTFGPGKIYVAIVGGTEDTAAAKIAVFKECGIEVAVTPSDMADALVRAAKACGAKLA